MGRLKESGLNRLGKTFSALKKVAGGGMAGYDGISLRHRRDGVS
jgi:hypothetical protein